MTRHVVCKLNDLSEGQLKSVSVGRSPIILCVLKNGDIKAFYSKCPHHGADLTYSSVTGITVGDSPDGVSIDRLGEILRCPWHGFEYDLVTGQSLIQSCRLQLREYQVVVEGDDVIIEL